MIKILIFGLMLIASESAYSEGKEYTIKKCKNVTVTDVEGCDKCKVVGKISFKISKSQDSVMTNIVLDTGKKISEVKENCKIFDEETFECKTTNEIDGTKMNLTFRMMLSNEKWINTFDMTGPSFYFSENISNCGEEIKSDFNFFK